VLFRSLDNIAAEQDAARVAAGVEDGVLEIEGVTLPMAVIFGQNDIKTVEDVAGLVPDDLNGYTEYKDGERIHEDGLIEHMGLTNDEATNLIMQARVQAGWIEASALDVEEEAELDEDGNPVLTAETLFESA
jgi:N utilization substance protein A